jgi:hypothetical protein
MPSLSSSESNISAKPSLSVSSEEELLDDDELDEEELIVEEKQGLDQNASSTSSPAHSLNNESRF